MSVKVSPTIPATSSNPNTTASVIAPIVDAIDFGSTYGTSASQTNPTHPDNSISGQQRATTREFSTTQQFKGSSPDSAYNVKQVCKLFF
jgi:hypothetical protein